MKDNKNDVLIDGWYAKYLDFEDCSFDSWLESKIWYAYARPFLQSGFFRGILLYVSSSKKKGIVLGCDTKGFWTFLILKALFNLPAKCFALEFIRRRPIKLINKLFYPAWLYCVAIPVVRKCIDKAQVMTLWEKNCYTEMFSVSDDTFVHIPFPLNRTERLSNLKRNHDVILSSGRQSCDWKTLIEAARLLPQYKFVIVHSVQDSRIFNRLTIPQNCKLLSNIPQSEHDQLLETATCYVMTLLDTFGSSGHVRLSHAVHCETPVIATDVMALCEYLTDNETVLFVPQKDPVALKEALLRLMNDAAFRERLAGNAKRRSEAWTRTQYFQHISDVIKQMI